MIVLISTGSVLLSTLAYFIIKTTDIVNVIGYCGIILCAILGILGTSRGMSSISKYISGVCVQTPRVGTKGLLGTAICEAGLIGTVLHCIVLFYRMFNMESTFSNNWLVLCSGVVVGTGYFFSSTAVGIVCGVISLVDAKNDSLFFKVFVFEFIPASIGIVGFVAGNLINLKIK